jgi:stage V sporulation protein B
MQLDDGKQVPSGSKLLKGAAILGIAAVISKLLGTLQKIPLQNIAGDEALGIYNAVYPLYILILLLATAGFPIAVSKFVAEQSAVGRYDEARRILRWSAVLLTATSLCFFLLLYYGAGWISSLIGNRHTETAIRGVAFALLFVPLMAALRGYFQGLHNMVPTAVSQVIEQTVRVATMIWLLLLFVEWGYPQSIIAAGAVFGSVTGAAAGLVVMIYYWIRAKYKDNHVAYAVDESREPAYSLIKRFVYYALPVCLGSIVLPILNIVDTFTIPRILLAQGMTESAAMNEFGVYGRGLPLVQLVAMVATSMSVALVPAIAEAKSRGDHRTIRVRTELAMRFTWMIGLAASVGLAVAATPINIMFYKNDEGSAAMAIMAFTAVFSTLNIVSASILQGVGAVMIPVRNLLVAAAIKVACNLIFLPFWGIQGAALSAVVAFAAASILNMAHLSKSTGASFTKAHYLYRPLASLLWMSAVLIGLIYGLERIFLSLPGALSNRLVYTLIALISVTAGAVIYMAAVFRTGAVRREDLLLVPSVYRRIQPILSKLRLMN